MEVVCTQSCLGVSWEHIGAQLFLVAALWLGFTIYGVGTAAMHTTKSAAKARKQMAGWEHGFASGRMSVILICATHFFQVSFFIIRSYTRRISPQYYAIELLCCIFLIIDTVLSWRFTTASGMNVVVRRAFCGPLALDLIVSTTALAVVTRTDEGLTWFNFSFLAALRLLLLMGHSNHLQEYVTRRGWQGQFCHQCTKMALWVCLAASTIMTFEHLEGPYEEPESGVFGQASLGGARGRNCGGAASGGEWTTVASIYFVVSTVSTTGGGGLAPRTIFGRCFTIGIIFGGMYMFSTALRLVLDNFWKDADFDIDVYTPRWHGIRTRHALVVGSPSPQMLQDFLQEVMNLEHYVDEDWYERAAPDVVILVPDREKLLGLKRYFQSREGRHLRSRVTLLRGEPTNPRDLKRAALRKANLAVVLPDLTASDVVSDDSLNAMRALALRSAAPEVHTFCLLHCAESVPLMKACGWDHSQFTCINEFRSVLMARACSTQGTAAFICNLCRTGDSISDDLVDHEHWHSEYACGLSRKLHEVPLSYNYWGSLFCDVAADILRRSDGLAYLIGVVETPYANDVDWRGQTISIHPGMAFPIGGPRGSLIGVFIAPRVSDIIQTVYRFSVRSSAVVETSESFDGSQYPPTKASVANSATQNHSMNVYNAGASVQLQLPASGHKRALVEQRRILDTELKDKQKGERLPGGATDSAVDGDVVDALLLANLRESGGVQTVVPRIAVDGLDPFGLAGLAGSCVSLSPERHEISQDQKKWQQTMTGIGLRLLAAGVDVGIVADLSHVDAPLPRAIKQGADNKQPGDRGQPRRRQAIQQDIPDAGGAMIVKRRGALNTVLDFGQNETSAAHAAVSKRLKINDQEGPLRVLQSLEQQHERLLILAATPQPLAPTPAMLREGGHILLCVVADPFRGFGVCHSSFDVFGPSAGLEPFLSQLRGGPMQGKRNAEQRKVVVLAEELPCDWRAALDLDWVYFVEGSPLVLADLQRAGFCRARSIAIVQAKGDERGGVSHMRADDGRVVTCAVLIGAHVPRAASVPVIVDFTYAASCDFLPLRRPLQAIIAAKRMKQVMKCTDHVSWSAPERSDALIIGGVLGALATKESKLEPEPWPRPREYSVNETDQAILNNHPLFACGQVFVSSLMTTFVAKMVHNPSFALVIRALLKAEMLLLPVPLGWEEATYLELWEWLLFHRNLLAVGIYRAARSNVSGTEKLRQEDRPMTHHYVITAPRGQSTQLRRSDRILCVVPCGDRPQS